MVKNTRTFYALSLLVALGIIWGSGYSIAKFAMENDAYIFRRDIHVRALVNFTPQQR